VIEGMGVDRRPRSTRGGIATRGTVETTDEALWERTLAVNLKGPGLGIKTCPWLKKKRHAGRHQHRQQPAPRDRCRVYSRLGTSKAGCSVYATGCGHGRVSRAGITLQYGCPGLGRHPGRADLPCEARRTRFPKGVRKPDDFGTMGAMPVWLSTTPGRPQGERAIL